MKLLVLASVMFIGSSLVRAQASFTDPIAYNDYVVEQQFVVYDAIAMILSADILDSAALWSAYNQSLLSVKRTNLTIKNLPPFEQNTKYLLAAQAIFQFYEDVFTNDYPKMLKGLAFLNATEAEYAELDAIILSISEREAKLDEQFKLAQTEFALKYNFTLEESLIEEE